jgi:hypothetical protein
MRPVSRLNLLELPIDPTSSKTRAMLLMLLMLLVLLVKALRSRASL